jgi:hypothetical protein
LRHDYEDVLGQNEVPVRISHGLKLAITQTGRDFHSAETGISLPSPRMSFRTADDDVRMGLNVVIVFEVEKCFRQASARSRHERTSLSRKYPKHFPNVQES